MLFQQTQDEVRGYGHQGRRRCPRQKEVIVVLSETAKDVNAKTTGADSRGDCGYADGDYSCDSDTGQNHTHSEGQFYLPKYLTVGHAHRHRRLAHRLVHAE